jgi:hypothetical protein
VRRFAPGRSFASLGVVRGLVVVVVVVVVVEGQQVRFARLEMEVEPQILALHLRPPLAFSAVWEVVEDQGL